MSYYWVTTQALVFRSRKHLAEFFPRLPGYSTLCFSVRDVLSSLGPQWHGKFEGEVVTEIDHAVHGCLPGRRAQHRDVISATRNKKPARSY